MTYVCKYCNGTKPVHGDCTETNDLRTKLEAMTRKRDEARKRYEDANCVYCGAGLLESGGELRAERDAAIARAEAAYEECAQIAEKFARLLECGAGPKDDPAYRLHQAARAMRDAAKAVPR